MKSIDNHTNVIPGPIGDLNQRNMEKRIQADMVSAMKAKETVRLASLRAIKAAIMLAKTAEGATGEVDDAAIVKIIQKLVKQRKESAQQYNDAGRPELAENELAEAAAMEVYLPKQLSEAELEDQLKVIIAEVGATKPQEMGKVMGVATKMLAGLADGKMISALVKKLLASFAILFALTSCELIGLDKDTIKDILIPDAAKPSKEFTPGNAADEEYAAHAVKYAISDNESPYESVELFGDGTYLIVKTGAVQGMTRAENEYFIEGGYVMKEEGHYTLEDFGTLKVEEKEGEYNLTFDNTYGNRISTVFASKEPVLTDEMTESLCRTWDVSGIDQWMYLGALKLAEISYIGGTNPHYEGAGISEIDEETLEDLVGETCCKVIFSPSGTYYCTYNNGTVLYSTWTWVNKEQGTLFYDWKKGENEEGYVTVRFDGDKCNIYEDYTIDLSGALTEEDLEDAMEDEEFVDLEEILGSSEINLRYLIVNKFQPAK